MASRPLSMLGAMESLWQLVVLTQVPAILYGPLPASSLAPIEPTSLLKASTALQVPLLTVLQTPVSFQAFVLAVPSSQATLPLVRDYLPLVFLALRLGAAFSRKPPDFY